MGGGQDKRGGGGTRVRYSYCPGMKASTEKRAGRRAPAQGAVVGEALALAQAIYCTALPGHAICAPA